MIDDNNIEDWYREELSDYHVDPEGGGWQAISDNLDKEMLLTDDNIGEWYKREVSKIEETPNHAVWERLAASMDTASVWSRLVTTLDKYDKFIWWRGVVFRGFLVALCLLGSYGIYNQYFRSASNQKVALGEPNEYKKSLFQDKVLKEEVQESWSLYGKNKASGKAYLSDKTSGFANESVFDMSEKNMGVARNEGKRGISDGTFGKQENLDADDFLAHNGKVESMVLPIPFRDWMLLHGSDDEEAGIILDDDKTLLSEKDIYSREAFLVKKSKNRIIFNDNRFSGHFVFGVYARRMYVGINAGIRNQTTFLKIKNNHPLAVYTSRSFLSAGNSLGAIVGLIVSDKWNIETNINLSSTSGYKRSYFFGESDFVERLNLNYSTVSVFAKKMNNKSTFDNKKYSTNILVGAYVGYLNVGKVTVENIVSDVKDQYRNVDAGVILGIEQDIYLSDKFVITPGVRGNQGILNTSTEANKFSSTRNFSIDFNLGMKYVFLKRGLKKP